MPDDNGREQEEDAGCQDRLDSTEQQLEQKEQGNHHQQLEMQMEQGEQQEGGAEQQEGVEQEQKTSRLSWKEKNAIRRRQFKAKCKNKII